MAETSTMSGCVCGDAQLTSDNAAIKAFLARPMSAAGPARAVLILHEWWGLADHIRDVARRCAQEGWVALAPDLYSRLGSKVAATPQEAAALMTALSAQLVLRDLNASTQYLKTLPSVDPLLIGIIGFGMGGTFALTQVTHNSDLKAAVVFYGRVPPIETLDYLLCPVQYHYAGKDGWVTQQEVDRLTEGFEKFNKPGEVHTYPGADHAFLNDARPEVYRLADASLAWQRTVQLLNGHLR